MDTRDVCVRCGSRAVLTLRNCTPLALMFAFVVRRKFCTACLRDVLTWPSSFSPHWPSRLSGIGKTSSSSSSGLPALTPTAACDFLRRRLEKRNVGMAGEVNWLTLSLLLQYGKRMSANLEGANRAHNGTDDKENRSSTYHIRALPI